MILIGLRSGGHLGIDLKEVDVSQVKLSDVAAGIAHQMRFAGQLHVGVQYSVAEHSVYGSRFAEDPLAFLFHDAAEGLGLGDVHFGVKALLAGNFAKLEAALHKALCEKFSVNTAHDKTLDTALGNEEYALFHPAYPGKFPEGTVLLSPKQRAVFHSWANRRSAWNDPEYAAEQWQARYRELTRGK